MLWQSSVEYRANTAQDCGYWQSYTEELCRHLLAVGLVLARFSGIHTENGRKTLTVILNNFMPVFLYTLPYGSSDGGLHGYVYTAPWWGGSQTPGSSLNIYTAVL